MINNFADFCLWIFVIVDDIWKQIAPLFDRPGPMPICSDSELISMATIGECRGWNLETEMLSQWREYPCFRMSPVRAGSIVADAT